MQAYINFQDERPNKNGANISYPIILENGKEIGIFRHYYKSGNWTTILIHNYDVPFRGKNNVNDKDRAIKILTKRLDKHGVKLVDAQEVTPIG